MRSSLFADIEAPKSECYHGDNVTITAEKGNMRDENDMLFLVRVYPCLSKAWNECKSITFTINRGVVCNIETKY